MPIARLKYPLPTGGWFAAQWPNGWLKIAVRGSDGGAVMACFLDWCQGTGLRPVSEPIWEQADIRVLWGGGSPPNWSAAGATAASLPKAGHTMRIVEPAKLAHEVGHAAFACEHEQDNPTRPWEWQPWVYEAGIPRIAPSDQYLWTPYEPAGAMHYDVHHGQTVPSMEVHMATTPSAAERALARQLNPPDQSADEAWIRKLYADPQVLGRTAPPTNIEVGWWLHRLSVSTRSAVAGEIVSTQEYRYSEVERLYRDVLRRTSPPSPAEVGYWQASPLGIEEIKREFLASDEYYKG